MGNYGFKYTPAGLLCGIDGGGTTTKVIVCTLEGEIVFSFQTGTINHYGAGTERAAKCFSGIADKLVENLGCLPGTIFTGNSALEGLAGEELIKELTLGVFEPSRVIFHSDAYVALLGFTLGNPGAVLISGTGSMACGIGEDGHYHTAGGWGQLLGDEGSGYHLALEGIKSALLAYDGLTAPTQLTDRVVRYFNLGKMQDLIDIVYNPPVEKSVIAAFALEVESAASEGDETALRILEAEAEWLYKLALAITGKCKTKNLGYYGSVLNHNGTVRSHLAARLSRHGITLQAPQFSPEIGALIGAFREAGISLTSTIINNLKKYK